MDLILEILSIPLVQSILKIAFIILLFAMPLGTVLTLMERKWSAMIQDRVGPNRANVGNYTGNGLLHLAADGLKSIFKEDTIPQGANGFLYLIAPFFGLIAGVATFAIIPIAGPIGDFTFPGDGYRTRFTFHLRHHLSQCLRSSACRNQFQQQVCTSRRNPCIRTNDFLRSIHGFGIDGNLHGLRFNPGE